MMDDLDFTVSVTTAVYTPGRTPLPLSPPKPFESRSATSRGNTGTAPARSLSSNDATNDITAEGVSEAASMAGRRSTSSRVTPTAAAGASAADGSSPRSSDTMRHGDTVPATERSGRSAPSVSSVPPLRFSVSPETVDRKVGFPQARRGSTGRGTASAASAASARESNNNLPYGDERRPAHDPEQDAQYTLNEVSCIQTLLQKGLGRLDRAKQQHDQRRSSSARPSGSQPRSSVPQPQPLPAGLVQATRDASPRPLPSAAPGTLQRELQRALQQKAVAEEERDALKAAAAASNAQLRVAHQALQRAMESLEEGAAQRPLQPPAQPLCHPGRRSSSLSEPDASGLIEAQRRTGALRSSSQGGGALPRSKGPSHPQRVLEGGGGAPMRSISPPARIPLEAQPVRRVLNQKPLRLPLGRVQPNSGAAAPRVVSKPSGSGAGVASSRGGRPRHTYYTGGERERQQQQQQQAQQLPANSNESVVIAARPQREGRVGPSVGARKVKRTGSKTHTGGTRAATSGLRPVHIR